MQEPKPDPTLIETKANQPTSVPIHYIKGNGFRVLHCDGAMIGSTTRGLIHIEVYSERPPIPTETVHNLKADGSLGDEDLSKRIGRVGIVRDVEASILLSPGVAESLADVLMQKVVSVRKFIAESEKSGR